MRALPKRTDGLLKGIDRPVAIAFACIVALLLVGSLYSRSFLSPDYLLQQLKVASFLGVIATGTMIVILLGQIDLSVPWVVAVGGMMSTAATGWGPVGLATRDSLRDRLRSCARARQRLRRRLPAHSRR